MFIGYTFALFSKISWKFLVLVLLGIFWGKKANLNRSTDVFLKHVLLGLLAWFAGWRATVFVVQVLVARCWSGWWLGTFGIFPGRAPHWETVDALHRFAQSGRWKFLAVNCFWKRNRFAANFRNKRLRINTLPDCNRLTYIRNRTIDIVFTYMYTYMYVCV